MKLFSAKGSSPPVIEAARLFRAHYGFDVVVEACGQRCSGNNHKAHENHHGFTSEVTAGEYDLAIAGSEADMDDLEMTGIVVEGSRHSLGLRETAILIPAENSGRVRTFEDLFQPGMRVAVSTIDCLRGVWEDVAGRAGKVEALRKNIIHRVTGCMALIESVSQGRVDAAIGWTSFTRFHPNIESIPLPEEYRIYRSTCISVLKGVREKGPEIQSFIDFLCSREGRNIFERHGWMYDQRGEKD